MVPITIVQQLELKGWRQGFARAFAASFAEAFKERLAEDRAECREEGRTEGQASLFLMLLEERFGPIPADVVERVRTAGTAELTVWSKSLLYARDLHGVFGSCADR